MPRIFLWDKVTLVPATLISIEMPKKVKYRAINAVILVEAIEGELLWQKNLGY